MIPIITMSSSFVLLCPNPAKDGWAPHRAPVKDLPAPVKDLLRVDGPSGGRTPDPAFPYPDFVFPAKGVPVREETEKEDRPRLVQLCAPGSAANTLSVRAVKPIAQRARAAGAAGAAPCQHACASRACEQGYHL